MCSNTFDITFHANSQTIIQRILLPTQDHVEYV